MRAERAEVVRVKSAEAVERGMAIALQTLGETRISILVAWPHLRPGHWKVTQPALRSIPDAARVARMLAEAAEARLTQPTVTRAAGLAPVAAE